MAAQQLQPLICQLPFLQQVELEGLVQQEVQMVLVALVALEGHLMEVPGLMVLIMAFAVVADRQLAPRAMAMMVVTLVLRVVLHLQVVELAVPAEMALLEQQALLPVVVAAAANGPVVVAVHRG